MWPLFPLGGGRRDSLDVASSLFGPRRLRGALCLAMSMLLLFSADSGYFRLECSMALRPMRIRVLLGGISLRCAFLVLLLPVNTG